MHTLYNSDSFAVVSFELPGTGNAADSANDAPAQRGGFEVIDKLARKEIFIDGALALHFQQSVQALVAGRADGDVDSLQAQIDEFLAGYTALAQQPVLLH